MVSGDSFNWSWEKPLRLFIREPKDASKPLSFTCDRQGSQGSIDRVFSPSVSLFSGLAVLRANLVANAGAG
jgi:hypothetical protein